MYLEIMNEIDAKEICTWEYEKDYIMEYKN